MNDQIRKSLEQLTLDQKDKRFQELRAKLALANPIPLSVGMPPPEARPDELEEYYLLKEMLDLGECERKR